MTRAGRPAAGRHPLARGFEMRGSLRAWPFALALAGATVDQATKGWAEARLAGRGVLPLLDGFLELRYTRNPGAFFGLGDALPIDVRRALLCGASLGIAVLLVSFYRRARSATTSMHAGVALVLAGTLGNLADRVLRGEVVDFLHLRAGDPTFWTTFNVADLFIVLGLAALGVAVARMPERDAPIASPGGGR